MGFLLDRQEVTSSNLVLPTSVNLIFYKEFHFLFAMDLQCGLFETLIFYKKGIGDKETGDNFF